MPYTTEVEHALLTDSELYSMVGPTGLSNVRKMYQERGEFYHGWHHALDVLRAVMGLQIEQDAVRRAYALAALFHDVVYVAGDRNNEVNSVTMLRALVDLPTEVGIAGMLILETSRHMTATVENTPEGHRDFMDCDLLSLSDPCWTMVVKNDYSECAERLAHGWSVEDVLEQKKTFLQNMLTKPTIFLGQHYGPRHEWQARRNIKRLLGHTHIFLLAKNSYRAPA
jgi:predicted metal-dependent HD superfamily phosphohydrolase